MGDDPLLEVYNREMIALAAEVESPRHLATPEMTARAVSPICGSEVEVEISLKDDKVADFGYTVEACALTKAVVAVMKYAIVGKSREDIAKAGAALRAMLEDAGAAPSGDWAGLKILLPVRDYKARHNSILLPFEAVEEAFKKRG